VGRDLAEGRLIVLMPEYQPVESELSAIYPLGKSPSAKVRTLIDFLAAASGRSRPGMNGAELHTRKNQVGEVIDRHTRAEGRFSDIIPVPPRVKLSMSDRVSRAPCPQAMRRACLIMSCAGRKYARRTVTVGGGICGTRSCARCRAARRRWQSPTRRAASRSKNACELWPDCLPPDG